MDALRDRYRGALLGLACGDAVGTTVEFSPRGSFTPLVDMVGGGPFSLQPGQWTDDTSMALCLAESLIEKNGFDAADQMVRYLNWKEWGYLSATGTCFDIGNTVRAALARFAATRDPYSGATDRHTAGNGSLMRLAPVVLFAHPDTTALHHYAAHSSRTTHGAPEAVECCQLFAELISRALAGCHRDALFDGLRFLPQEEKVAALATGSFIGKDLREIRGNGYCVDSLEAALWCFFGSDSFEEAVLKAANLGDDADTTAAIAGQIAGAYYGAGSIPSRWLHQLAMRDDIETMADTLFARFCKS